MILIVRKQNFVYYDQPGVRYCTYPHVRAFLTLIAIEKVTFAHHQAD
jgi:hypothetical protein